MLKLIRESRHTGTKSEIGHATVIFVINEIAKELKMSDRAVLKDLLNDKKITTRANIFIFEDENSKG